MSVKLIPSYLKKGFFSSNYLKNKSGYGTITSFNPPMITRCENPLKIFVFLGSTNHKVREQLNYGEFLYGN